MGDSKKTKEQLINELVELRLLISENKLTEDSLRKREKQLADSQRVAHLGSWEWDIINNKITWSDELYRIFGLAPQEFEATYEAFLGMVHPDDQQYLNDAVQKSVREKNPYHVDARIIRQDGVEWIMEARGEITVDKLGNPILMGGTAQDITKRKQMEEGLSQSNQRLFAILDSINALIYVADMDRFEVLFINKYGKDIWGDISGQTCWKALQQGQTGPCKFCTNKQIVDLDGHPSDVYTWEFQNTVNGHWYYIHDKAIKWNDGRIVRLEIATDITDRKEAEEESKRLRKELEQLISVTSHDLKSPLVNIAGYNKEINYSLKKLVTVVKDFAISEDEKETITSILDQDISESTQYITASVVKINSLLSGLLKLSKSGSVELLMKKINMNRLLSKVMLTLEYQFIESRAKHYISELPSCIGDENQLNQLFANLIGNAIKYLDSDRLGLINITGYKNNGKTVYCVTDNGIGIETEAQEKIFDFFYQANPDKEGEGLGLNIVKKIIERHRGGIWVESELGKGSKFFVSLPS